MNPCVIIDHFVPEPTCTALRTLQRGARSPGPQIDPNYSTADRRELLERADPDHLVVLDRVRARVRQQLGRYFDIESRLYPSFTDLACFAHGAEHPAHADNAYFVVEAGQLVWKPRPGFAHRAYSAILYLNDYDSGTLEFGNPHGEGPRLAIRPTLVARPQAGRLVLFESSAAHIHRVTRCEHGDRYSLAMWFTLDPRFREPDSFVAAACLHRLRASAAHDVRLSRSAQSSIALEPGGARELGLTLVARGRELRVLVDETWRSALNWLIDQDQPFSLAQVAVGAGLGDIVVADCVGLLLRHGVLDIQPTRGDDATRQPQC